MTARGVLGHLLLAVTLLGCVPVHVDGRNLDFSTWRAVSIAGVPPIPGDEPTLQ